MERYDIRQGEWRAEKAEAGDFVLYADAQATVEALQAQLKDMVLRNKILRDRLDLPPERCAFHDEVVSLQTRVKELESITKVICGHCCEPMEIPSKAVLQSQLTQRTAELEVARAESNLAYAKGVRDGGENNGYQSYAIAFSEWYKCLTEIAEIKKELHEQTNKAQEYERQSDHVAAALSVECAQVANLQAELERVRDQFADLRKMVAALPKVAGAVVVSNGYVKDSTRCHALFGADEDAALYAALLQHRQGMEG